MSNNINTPRPLSPNTLEAKARARSIAATNAARASVAARRARFERALLEQRVRSLKSQFCSRKRLIFNWAKSLADVSLIHHLYCLLCFIILLSVCLDALKLILFI